MSDERCEHGVALRGDCSACTYKQLHAEAEEENDRLRALVYVPGLRRCAKCQCFVMTQEISVPSGSIRPKDEPKTCPNGCGPMWPVTERQAGNEAIDREDKLKARVKELEEQVKDLSGENLTPEEQAEVDHAVGKAMVKFNKSLDLIEQVKALQAALRTYVMAQHTEVHMGIRMLRVTVLPEDYKAGVAALEIK